MNKPDVERGIKIVHAIDTISKTEMLSEFVLQLLTKSASILPKMMDDDKYFGQVTIDATFRAGRCVNISLSQKRSFQIDK